MLGYGIIAAEENKMDELKTNTQVCVDTDILKQVEPLFDRLGLDLSTAVNVFLYQCKYHNGLPFSVRLPKDYHNEGNTETEGNEP